MTHLIQFKSTVKVDYQLSGLDYSVNNINLDPQNSYIQQLIYNTFYRKALKI